jgi:beta-lactamase superfamily II metal-dependent hydrolase
MLNGLEVDMLSVGNADCILATKWFNGAGTRVLIDGANKGNFETVRGFLKARGIIFLDAVVCTHPHDDHAAGLLELVKDKTVGIGAAYMHVPQWHVDLAEVSYALKLARGSAEGEAFRKSLTTVKELVDSFNARGLSIIEPFAGTIIQFLTVVGPSQNFYEELQMEFTDPEKIKKIDGSQTAHSIWSALHDHAIDSLNTELPENPQTTPENNSSAILATIYENEKFLFTSDAGVPALQKASEEYVLKDCLWMQIPHHGSRRNISPVLIKHFSPKLAWVSAEGSKKHPRRAVVNAFKEAGTVVNSTHYPTSTNMWLQRGTVPSRVGYSPLVALYDEPVSKSAQQPQNIWLRSLLNAK